MSDFTQTKAQAVNTSNAAMSAAMAMMPAMQACQNQQQASQRQQTQRQSQNMRTHLTSFTQAENNPVFCFFYSSIDCQSSQNHPYTLFTKRSTKIVNRPEETLNHAHKGGARI